MKTKDMARPNTRTLRNTRQAALGTAGVVAFLAVWQLIPVLGIIDRRFLPYATDVLAKVGHEALTAAFWNDVRLTMTSWALGLLIAVTAAVILGTVIGLVPFLRRATHTTVEFLRPIPSVALIPLAILLFGLRLEAALVIVVYASFWQVFVQVLYGVADVDVVARDTARSYGLSRMARFRSLVLPTALPYIMTGVRLAAAVALILAVTAEMTITNPGLGRNIVLAQASGDYVRIYSVVMVTGLLGLLVNVAFRALERRVLSWHESVRGEEV
jgi:ABC-type nitrate/sulfonate/bicarbonate transport system permease component